MRKLVTTGSPFEKQAGYSRAVAIGDLVFVAGTTGYDYATMTISADPAEQARQTLRNIEWALSEAGAALADVVRATYYLPDMNDWAAVREVAMEVFRDILPAATAVQAALVNPAMKVEIEVTAVRPPAAVPGAAAASKAKAAAKPRAKATTKAKAKPAAKAKAKAKPARKPAARKAPARKAPARKPSSRKKPARR